MRGLLDARLGLLVAVALLELVVALAGVLQRETRSVEVLLAGQIDPRGDWISERSLERLHEL
jgi:hypothetical protein